MLRPEFKKNDFTMSPNLEIKTERLLLRPWNKEDLEPLAAMNGDPRVMQYFSSLTSHEECEASIQKYLEHIRKYGWGIWAVSLKDTGEFIGFMGLQHTSFQAPFTPAVEMRLRLAFPYWNKGYGTEGCKACLQCGFENILLQEIVSCVSIENRRARALVEKLGMSTAPEEDFDHPRVPKDHPLRRYALYRLKVKDYRDDLRN